MRIPCSGIVVLAAALGCAAAQAQAPATPDAPPPPAQPPMPAGVAPVPIEWTPPALAQLSAQALSKSSFTFDRTMLAAAAGMMGDDETRAALAKLDGLSVHVLHFADDAPADPGLVESIRDAYHLKGWKHVVSASQNGGGPVHDAKTDVWVAMDGVNLRGAVVLVSAARELTLATVSGDLSPADLLHLRGHFGIPKFDGDGLAGQQ